MSGGHATPHKVYTLPVCTWAYAMLHRLPTCTAPHPSRTEHTIALLNPADSYQDSAIAFSSPWASMGSWAASPSSQFPRSPGARPSALPVLQ